MKKSESTNTITLTTEQFNAIMDRISGLEKMLANQQEKADAPVSPKKAASAPKKTAEKPAKTGEKRRTWEVRTIAVKRDKGCVTYTWDDGSYVFDKGVRMYVNSIIRAEGGVWNADIKAYAFPDAKSAAKFEKAYNGYTVEAAKVDAYIQSKKK